MYENGAEILRLECLSVSKVMVSSDTIDIVAGMLFPATVQVVRKPVIRQLSCWPSLIGCRRKEGMSGKVVDEYRREASMFILSPSLSHKTAIHRNRTAHDAKRSLYDPWPSTRLLWLCRAGSRSTPELRWPSTTGRSSLVSGNAADIEPSKTGSTQPNQSISIHNRQQ